MSRQGLPAAPQCLGMNCGGQVDGVIGDLTRDAFRVFQMASGIAVTADLTGDVYQLLYTKAFE